MNSRRPPESPKSPPLREEFEDEPTDAPGRRESTSRKVRSDRPADSTNQTVPVEIPGLQSHSTATYEDPLARAAERNAFEKDDNNSMKSLALNESSTNLGEAELV